MIVLSSNSKVLLLYVLVDFAGRVLGGGSNRLLNQAAFLIHAAIHKVRPGVLCGAHNRSSYGHSFCALG